MEPTRVLFMYPQPGFELPPWAVLALIINNLDRKRFTPVVLAGEHSKGNPRIAADVAIHRFALERPVDLARNLWAMRNFVTREKIDVIHANEDGRSAALGSLLSVATRRPLVLHHHAPPHIYSGARLAALRACALVAARNIGVSEYIANEVRELGAPADTTSAILTGIDCERFQPSVDGSAIRREYGIKDDELLVTQIARFWRPKRQEDVVRAIAIARREDPRIRGLLIGWDDPRYDGPAASYREEVRALAQSLGVGDAVVIAAARPEADQVHAATDIAVLASEEEPLGLVMLEALATGRPFLGARSGGIPECIEDGVTGMLVPPRSPEALAAKILELARDPSLRDRLGTAARRSAETQFFAARTAAAFQPLYAELAHHRSAA